MNYKRNAKYFRKHPSWIPPVFLFLLGAAIVYLGRAAEPRIHVESDAPFRIEVDEPFEPMAGEPFRERRLEDRVKSLVNGRFSETELERITLAGTAVLLLAGVLLGRLICWPRDKDIDNVRLELLGSLRERALQTLGIDEEEISRADPIEFASFEFPPMCAEDKQGRPLIPMIRGRDGFWRSPVCTVIGLYFSKTTVHCYRLARSITSPAQREETNDFWYNDIVSVKLTTQEIPAIDKNGNRINNKTVRYNEFSLRNAGGETFACSVRDYKAAEEAAIGMRSLLREVKNGASEQEPI